MSKSVSRRSLLKLTGAGAAAVAAAPLLSACTTSSASSGVSNVGASLAPWPTTVPNNAFSKFSLPALPNNGAPAELAYPSLPLRASVEGTVGDGSTVSMLTFSYGSPIQLNSSNRLLAAINKAVNLTLSPDFVIETTGTSYTTAVSTAQASGNLPDLLTVGLAAVVPEQSQFVEDECADLTEYLSGDAIKDYPNLASIPQRGWELMGRINGKIYGVPVYRYNAPLQGLFVNQEAFQSAGLWTGKGLSVAEFTAGLEKLNGNGKTALGADSGSPFGWTSHILAAGAPYNWSEKNGQFTNAVDSPAFLQGLENMAAFYKKGLYNADALTASSTEQTNDYMNGSWLSMVGGLSNPPFYVANLPFTPNVAYPYGSNPGITGGDETFCFTVLKKASPTRIKMLLRLLNYLAAPFGSKEWELAQYGVEGAHFTRGTDGSPATPTTLGATENATNMPFKYLALQPQPIFFPGKPQVTQRMYDSYKPIMEIIVPDPTAPYQSGSATYNQVWSGWSPAVNQAIADVVSGKQSLSNWSSIAGGLKSQFQVPQIEKELAQAYAAANKG